MKEKWGEKSMLAILSLRCLLPFQMEIFIRHLGQSSLDLRGQVGDGIWKQSAHRQSSKTFEVGWDEGCSVERLRKRVE